MKPFRETDRIFKERLEHYDSGAPMELFDRIEEGLGQERKKKRRGAAWWWAMGTAFLVLTVATRSWVLLSENNNVVTENVESVSPQLIANEIEPLTAESETKEVSENSKDVFSEKEKTSSKENKVSSNTSSKKSIPAISTIFISNKKETPSAITVEQNVIYNNQLPKDEFSSKGDLTSKFPTIEKTSKEKNLIALTDQLQSRSEMLTLNYDFKFNLPDIKCGEKKKRKIDEYFTTSMDVFVSPDRAFRFLEYKSDAFEEYATMRNESEKASLSFSAGLRFNLLRKTQGWAIRTGIIYSQINEIFETEVLETTTITDPVTGEVLGQTQFLRDVKSSNRYKMFDLPLLIGYEIPMKRSTINVNAGVQFNVSAQQKGTFLAPDGEQKVEFNSNQPDSFKAFRSNVGMSYYLSLGAAYKITPRYQFFFEPHLRYNPNSFTRKDYVLNQKYIFGGILLGIRKQLN